MHLGLERGVRVGDSDVETRRRAFLGAIGTLGEPKRGSLMRRILYNAVNAFSFIFPPRRVAHLGRISW